MNNGDSGTEASVWKESIPLCEILDHYYKEEDPSTGTVVIHAGRVKLPGKRKPGMTHVVLESVADDLVGGLRSITREAMKLFPVNRVQIHHRLGTALPGEHLLVVLISAAERGPAFDACRWVVDEIKKEKIIRLIEK